MTNYTRRSFIKTTGAFIGLSATFSFMNSCEKQEVSEQPNILFLFSDDHSVPDLGCYGNPVIHTPNLDQLAKDGIKFSRAYVSSPQCSPSRASVLTGRSSHDVHASRLHSDVPQYDTNLIQLLNNHGYYTGAFRKVHQPTIEDDLQFYGGADTEFTEFFDSLPENQPFFLWFGSTDPHRGYSEGAFEPAHNPNEVIVPDYLPDTPEVRQDIAYYYDEIARFDKECGEILGLLDERNLTENTLVVMAGDNGLPFPRAKATLYEAGIHVPLLMRWPDTLEAGQSSDALISLMDLTATWLDAANIQIPETMQSKSYLPLLEGRKSKIREYIFAERNWHDNWDPVRCVVSDRFKLIQNYRPEIPYIPSLDIINSPSYQVIEKQEASGELQGKLEWYGNPSRPQIEFYDLEEDPGEWENLANNPDHDDRIAEYQSILSDWMEETHDFLPPPRGAFPGGLDSRLNRTINPLNGMPYSD